MDVLRGERTAGSGTGTGTGTSVGGLVGEGSIRGSWWGMMEGVDGLGPDQLRHNKQILHFYISASQT